LCDYITNIIVLDINVLSHLMKHLIFSEVYGTLTIT
jgi:hypothetical protein